MEKSLYFIEKILCFYFVFSTCMSLKTVEQLHRKYRIDIEIKKLKPNSNKIEMFNLRKNRDIEILRFPHFLQRNKMKNFSFTKSIKFHAL